MDEVTYRQWQSTDRTQLVTITESTADFVESLLAKLHVLKVHMFILDMQTKQFCAVKENLSPGEVLIVGDFSENYSFVVKDAAQGVHCALVKLLLHPSSMDVLLQGGQRCQDPQCPLHIRLSHP